MFVHRNRLQHLLRPTHYRDPDHYASETKQLFRASWQFVCSVSEVQQDGDFRTVERFGVPILVRNFGGVYRAFQNICPHRHSMLTCEASGNSPVLKCQYHGWQFQCDGRTAKIPEPRAFRPWDRDNARLTPVRLERCGDLLFVCLDQEAPSLRDWLSPYFDTIENVFSRPDWRMAEAWDFDAACNWKVVIENTLESYHVAEVHPNWMDGQLPAEEHSEHELDERYTMLRFSNQTGLQARAVRACQQLGGTPIQGYWHLHVHPNLVFVFTDTFNYFATTIPTGPETCQVQMRMFPFWPSTNNPWKMGLRFACWRISRRMTRTIFGEDRTIYGAQQRGISRSPHRGVIGIREERIFQFQEYICRRLSIPPEPHPADIATEPSSSGM
ncbi:MAG: aromatic ring-hydroxylating dioxygenase subunit alpha [Planctomycetota bacterium]